MNNKDLVEIYRFAYSFLISYLDSLNLEKSSEAILEEELDIYRNRKPFDKMSEIYRNLLISLENRNMMNGVIPNEIFSDKNGEKIFFGFDPKLILENYPSANTLMETFRGAFPDRNIRDFSDKGRKTCWKQFADGAISGAKFLSRFKTANEFNNHISNNSKTNTEIVMLPYKIAQELDGMGFALTCDWLKESGFKNFCKPDVHIKEIFFGLGLVPSLKEDFPSFQKMVEMSKSIEESGVFDKEVPPVIIDKIFWLIGSGKFWEYNKKHDIPIPVHRLKTQFLTKYKEKF